MSRGSYYYQALRDRLNKAHKELQSMPEQYKLGYYHSVPSVLNAYREADISFDDACKILGNLTKNDTAKDGWVLDAAKQLVSTMRYAQENQTHYSDQEEIEGFAQIIRKHRDKA